MHTKWKTERLGADALFKTMSITNEHGDLVAAQLSPDRAEFLCYMPKLFEALKRVCAYGPPRQKDIQAAQALLAELAGFGGCDD